MEIRQERLDEVFSSPTLVWKVRGPQWEFPLRLQIYIFCGPLCNWEFRFRFHNLSNFINSHRRTLQIPFWPQRNPSKASGSTFALRVCSRCDRFRVVSHQHIRIRCWRWNHSKLVELADDFRSWTKISFTFCRHGSWSSCFGALLKAVLSNQFHEIV